MITKFIGKYLGTCLKRNTCNHLLRQVRINIYKKCNNTHPISRSFSTFESTRPLLQKSMSLKPSPNKEQQKIVQDTLKDSNTSLNSFSSEKEPENEDLLTRLHEQLINEINTNLNHPTFAENQVDTMEVFEKLSKVNWVNKEEKEEGMNREKLARLNIQRKEALLTVLLHLLNDEFYSSYNDKYLRDLELDKQSHLFNSLSSEIQYIIQNSRDIQLNNQHLQIMKLIRDLDSIQDEINELTINDLKKDCQLAFNNQKFENTLLYKNINLELNDSSNKITINILAGIRSSIENFRWQTTRSGLLALLVLVFLILTGVNQSKKKENNNNNNNNNHDNINGGNLFDNHITTTPNYTKDNNGERQLQDDDCDEPKLASK
ncbi:Put7p NDAI_0I01920 [Naumovozyma dairenensis CBS 421]|uniref:Uncharacterized protein n=1 Tax=Naumovozyma dairenensis (strain ATCC 10597 / BCRC 20456 / CBS 421 / NBRC 0211 / NRRL Y-12639) TaxID=1071378 RepID=G0WG50_NAUDC|nr:hypothetical protein NDAI_0I01920 [Naumovozyma dairenensis CBS 421]CCD26761.1 hypothetical protein NDAI_0I01920 [Naumovozyma dairenensis CBS 421]